MSTRNDDCHRFWYNQKPSIFRLSSPARVSNAMWRTTHCKPELSLVNIYHHVDWWSARWILSIRINVKSYEFFLSDRLSILTVFMLASTVIHSFILLSSFIIITICVDLSTHIGLCSRDIQYIHVFRTN